ncbi:hypothetical protein Tcan_18189 [Toxocara canis]|uniref:Uncharacterized protein n=1 Tax=Toxocara canis TaxID=6265 RepID=A0A0B2UY62_TOXCA|nr:hypothetical protein Tcan_18189 [Toxocara canis]
MVLVNAFLSTSLQTISLFINIAFVVEASRERHSRKSNLCTSLFFFSENRCHFLTHVVALCLSNFLLIFHHLTILDNPIKLMRSALVAQQSTFGTHVIWALGVVLALSRYMAIAIISLSRMVAQTFNVSMQIKRQYREISSSILVVLFLISFIAYVVIVIKKFFLNKRRSQHTPARDVEWMVYAIRSDPESEDSSEVIPHHPTVAPYFAYRELHFTLISFITLLIFLYQWIVNKKQLSSTSYLGASIVTSVCMPSMLLFYWTLPYVHRRFRFLAASSSKFNKLLKFVRSLFPVRTFCPCAHSRVTEGPVTLQMDQPRFSVSALTNGIPYRRRPNRSRSEDLGLSRVRIATIYMNNEH